MTVHRSHDRPRLERPRLRSLAAPHCTGAKPGDAEKRPHRTAMRALYASLRAADTDLAREAMRVARSLLRELGSPRSPSVHGHALTYGLQQLTAQRLALAADAAGLETDRGRALAADAQRAAGRSERAWVSAVTAAGLLGKAPTPSSDLAKLLAGKGDSK